MRRTMPCRSGVRRGGHNSSDDLPAWLSVPLRYRCAYALFEWYLLERLWPDYTGSLHAVPSGSCMQPGLHRTSGMYPRHHRTDYKPW